MELLKPNKKEKIMSHDYKKLTRLKRTVGKTNIRFTPANRQVIYEGLKARMPVEKICELIGIQPGMFKIWMEKGNNPDAPKKYQIFRNKVFEIRRERIMNALNTISKIAEGGWKQKETKVTINANSGQTLQRIVKEAAPNWNAAAWLLEKLEPETFGDIGNKDKKKTPDEVAREIQDALLAIDESVPKG